MPVLENSQGQLIYESVITCEYLDEVYPGKKLWPDDPYEKACQKILLESFSKVCVSEMLVPIWKSFCSSFCFVLKAKSVLSFMMVQWFGRGEEIRNVLLSAGHIL